MQCLEMQRVVMVTPFDEAMHQHIREYVGHAGLEIVGATSLREPDYANMYDVSILPLAHVYREARRAFRCAEAADGVWITGALMPSVGIIQQLEDDLGVPVVSSMQAMAWKGMRLAGANTGEIRGFGRLFQVSV